VLVCGVLAVGAWKVSRSRTFQFFGGLVPRVETGERVVALTFDDGPTPAGTDALLPLLDSLGIAATFFVTGRELAAHPALGRRLIAAGHALGNHSYSHQRMVLRSPSFVRREVEETDRLIRAAGWHGAIPFRPPFGKRLLVLPWFLHRTGRTTVLWDVEPDSDADVGPRAEQIAEDAVRRVRPGSIVLLHAMYPSRAESRRAVPLIVRGLRARGYRFVTVPQLLALPPRAAPDPASGDRPAGEHL